MGVQPWFLRQPQRPATAATADAARSGLDAGSVARSATVTPAPEPRDDAPAPVAESTTIAAPLAFVWMKGAHSMLLFSAVEDPAVLKLYHDVVLYADWLARQRALQQLRTESKAESATLALTPRAPQQGNFNWPQLQNSTGTPERSLAVWFDKQMSSGQMQVSWVGATADLMPDLSPWLGGLPVNVADVGDARRAVTDVQAKKALWQILQNQP